MFLLLFFQACSAQVDVDGKYNRAVNFVTCICINSALSENDKYSCDSQTPSIDGISDLKTKDLFKELQALKDKSNVSDYLKFLSEDIFEDQAKYKKIYEFATKREGKKIDDIKKEIKNFIENQSLEGDSMATNSDLIDNNSENIYAEENNLLVEKNSESKSSVDVKTPSFNIWTIILFVIVVFNFAFLIIIYKLLNKNVERLNERIDRRVKIVHPSILDNTRSNNSADNLKIKKLEESVRRLEAMLSTRSTQKPFIEEKSAPIIMDVPEKTFISEPVVFYMATPNKVDSTFDIISQTENFKATQTLYKFTLDRLNSSRAKFEFFSDEAGIRDSVDSPQTYTEPVCEPQNARNQGAKKIITLELGIAEKRNDKWVVTTKAKIKYE